MAQTLRLSQKEHIFQPDLIYSKLRPIRKEMQYDREEVAFEFCIHLMRSIESAYSTFCANQQLDETPNPIEKNIWLLD